MLGYLLFAGLVMSVLYGGYWYWRRNINEDLAIGAKADWDRLSRTDPELLKDLSEERFTEIYSATHLPRFPSYVVASAGIFLAGTPIVLGFLNALAYFGLRVGIVPQPGDAATELYFNADGASFVRKVSPEALSYILQGWSGFYLFFGLLFFWIGVVYVMMRRYHARTPGSLRDEILRAR